VSEKIIQLNEGAIKQELGDLVRQSVEDTLNALFWMKRQIEKQMPDATSEQEPARTQEQATTTEIY